MPNRLFSYNRSTSSNRRYEGWTPDLLPGIMTMIDPAANDSISLAEQPIIADFSVPANWSAFNGATLTQVPGYTGNALRVTYGGSINPFGRHSTASALTGNRYTLSGYLRTSGGPYVAQCVWAMGAGGGLETNSQSWEYKTREFTTVGSVLDFGYLDGLDTGAWWCELSNLAISNLSITQINPVAGYVPGYLSWGVATGKPWKSTTKINGVQVAEFNQDMLQFSNPAPFTCFHRDVNWSMCFVLQPTTVPVYSDTIFATFYAGYDPPGIRIMTSGAGGSIWVQISDGSSAYIIDNSYGPGSLTNGVACLLVIRHIKGGNIEAWVGGNKIMDAATVGAWDTTGTCPFAEIMSQHPGAPIGSPNMRMGVCVWADQAWSDADIARLGAWAKNHYGVTWV